METAIILLGALIAVISAVVFFGVFEKEKNAEFNMTEISSIARAENVFERLAEKDGECTAIYIGMFYQSLYINADSDKLIKARLSAEKKIKEFCGIFGGASARVDGNNYVVVWGAPRQETERFCKSFSGLNGGAESFADVSIGAYIARGGACDFQTAAGYAKKAARFVKNSGTEYKICSGRELDEVIDNENIEKNIEKFIDNDSFYPVFQPYYDAHTNKILGCEVLSRLDLDRTDGVLPSEFLQVIKRDKELCVKFDLYTFKKCCEWSVKNADKKISVTCNFSRLTLLSENSASDIIDIAQKTGADFKRIIIEIEDGHTDGGFEILRANTALLKKSGFKICLDDFGKGNTALGELSELMPDIIGIDKSVLYGAKNDCGEAVFGGAVRLAKEMNALVLCEGIETEAQAESAKKAECDILQGYFFCKPVNADTLENLLKNQF